MSAPAARSGLGFDGRLPFLRAIAILLPVGFLGFALYLAVGPLHDLVSSLTGFAAAVIVLVAAVTFFASMVFAAIGRLQSALLRQGGEMAALLDVGERVTTSLDLDEVMKNSVLAVASAMRVDAVEIWLLDAAAAQIILRKRCGPHGASLFHQSAFAAGEGIPGDVVRLGQPWVEQALPARTTAAGASHACAVVPLRCARGVTGVLAVGCNGQRSIRDPADIRILEAMADRIALAIDNANLHEQVQARAAITERERIARELHDGMAQILTYIGAKTHAVDLLLERGQAEEAQRQLGQMAEVAQELYAEVREAILALRTGVPDGGSLVDILRKYLAELESLTGLALSLEVDEPPGGLPVPSPMVEIQVLRIVQEALSNVRQHARATRAAVRLQSDAEGLVITIADNGQGFDLAQSHPDGRPRFGLQSMEERAKATGGSLAVASGPGQGTAISLRIPLARAVEA